VIKSGDAGQSALVQRILSPIDQDGHMPPDGEAQPTAQEAALIAWWINAGTPGKELA
jgi:hypothetical protein